MAGETGKIGEEPARVLVAHHAGDHHQRPRHAFLKIAERLRDHAPAIGIMAAVEPDFRVRRRGFCQIAWRQPLHPRRPFGVRETLLVSRRINPECLDGAERGNSQTRIVDLMDGQTAGVLRDRASRGRLDRPIGRFRH